MKLSDFDGKMISFGGVWEAREERKIWDDTTEIVDATYAMIDGHCFKFREDPSDGYRSSCDEPEEVEPPKGARFSLTGSPQTLLMKVGRRPQSSEYSYDSFDGVTLYKGDKIAAEFGTQNYDDYYPCYRSWVDAEVLSSPANKSVSEGAK